MNQIKNVTINELKKLYETNEYNIEIETPDGWKTISDWFNKGVLPIVELKTNNHTTKCALNHMIEVKRDGNFVWMLADEIEIGDIVLTDSGEEEIIEKQFCGEEECYDFTVESENHRYWGDGISSHNSGKSYICSGNVVKDALRQNVPVILIDTEDRLDEVWMRNIGIDPENPLLQRLQTNSIENVMQIVTLASKDYKEQNANIPLEEQSGLLFVIDSLGALYANDEIQRFGEGEMSMTDGMRRAGAMTKMVNNILSNIASTKMGCMVTNHVYATTDMYSDDVIPGGQKLIFLTTQILQMNKLKLKAKDVEGGVEGASDSDVVGIRSKCKVYKSNWNKCFETVEVQIPYTTGMNPYSGLFDLFEAKGVLKKEGNQYVYNSLKDGKEVFKKFRKNITNEDYDMLMKDFMETSKTEKSVDEILKEVEKNEKK